MPQEWNIKKFNFW